MRALSAVDLALWDLLGKSLNAPVYRLLGGKANPRVRLYNTCFPYKYDFNQEPEKIMQELIDTRGITALKIWPFDGAAEGQRQSVHHAQSFRGRTCAREGASRPLRIRHRNRN